VGGSIAMGSDHWEPIGGYSRRPQVMEIILLNQMLKSTFDLFLSKHLSINYLFIQGSILDRCEICIVSKNIFITLKMSSNDLLMIVL
jgi:hypothetical protein